MQGSCPIWDGANNGGGSVGFYENQWSTLWLSVCVCVCNPSRAPEQAGLALHSLQAATSAPGLVRQYTETAAKLSHTLTSSSGSFCCMLLTPTEHR